MKSLLAHFVAIFITISVCSSGFSQEPYSNNSIIPDSISVHIKSPLQSSDTTQKIAYSINNNNALNSDTLAVLNDTLSASADTTKIEYPLKSPIYSNAEDSLLYSLDGKMVFLYGDAVVKYENMELTAAYIEYNLETSVVFAEGKPDSTSKVVGKPIFKEGNQVYKMERMNYNFDSKKAKIVGVITEEAGGFLHSQETKLMDDNSINISGGKFTTCDLEHPHFYIGITKGKVIPGDRLIIGPAYIVIGDVPLPIGIPFGFFPNKKGRSSGIILPEYGEEQNRGFFLRNGGFYFGLNDYFDLALNGDIYSKGSWALNTRSSYRKRYRFSGNFAVAVSENVFGEKGQDDYIKNLSYSLRWSHSQDPKASPNSTFQASVNLGSPNHDRFNARSVDAFLTNTISSSVSYSKVWPGSPFSMSVSMNHNQNNLDSSITVGLPRASFNMSRIYPLKKKGKIGSPSWYENIGLSLSSRVDNSISTKTDKLFTEESIQKFKNGVQHNIPISTSFNLLKHIIVSPTASYTENWYTKTVEKYWDPDSMYVRGIDTLYGVVVSEDVMGFKRAWQYNTGISMNTKIYGMFVFKEGSPVQAIRHVMNPSVGLSYRPDFSKESYGFFRSVYTDKDTIKYSIFEGSLYGSPGSGKSGMVNFSISNNLEMKVRSSKDTISDFRKIKIFESFNLGTSYNLLADSMNWTPLSINARTTLFDKFNISLSSTLNPYALDSNGRASKYFHYDIYGKPFRLTNASANISFSLKGGESSKSSGQSSTDQLVGGGMLGSESGDAMFGEAIGTGYADIDYIDFNVPWSLRVNYTYTYSKPQLTKNIYQTVSFSGDVSLTPKWRIGFSSGYDIKKNKLTTTSLNFYRDLHCWEMRLSVVPIGFLKSFSFNINVKSGTLKELKYSKRQSYQDNL